MNVPVQGQDWRSPVSILVLVGAAREVGLGKEEGQALVVSLRGNSALRLFS